MILLKRLIQHIEAENKDDLLAACQASGLTL